MAKQAVTVKDEKQLYEVPAFMKEATATGAEEFSRFIVPPRFKVVQKQADDALLQKFNPGDVILIQQGVDPILVSPVRLNENGKPGDKGEPFWFIPEFFFAEWVQWNPIELKGVEPAIVDRTVDPRDPLVAKCRSPKFRQEKLREGTDGKTLYVRNVEHLNFVIRIAGKHPLAGMEGIYSFSKGEHRAGSSFMALHRQRGSNVVLYGCVYEASVDKRPGAKGQWHGIDVCNPSRESGVSPWVTPDEYAILEQRHKELAEAHAAQLLIADYDDARDYVDEEPKPGNSRGQF